MPHLSQADIGQILVQNAPKYKSSYTQEMKAMTAIKDFNKTIKTEAMGVEWQAILTKKWQLAYSIQEIDPEVLRVITTKCRGNPLFCLQYFVNMLHYGFIEVRKDGYVEPTDKFDYCESINDWSLVPVPRLALKINTQLLDQFYFSVKNKPA